LVDTPPTVPDTETWLVFIGKHNVNPTTGVVKVGASTSDAGFTVRVIRY
jgi:hypothetical protein